jgi:twitching motility protein PilJ
MNTTRTGGASAGNSMTLPSILVLMIIITAGGMGWAFVAEGRLLGNPGLVVALLGVILVILVAWLIIRDAQRRLREQAEQNMRNQEAILQLLDELADLADGDLRIQASVTENFTGAIADSINFAIDQMRALVSNINRLSVQVASAAGETQGTARTLAEASENQRREITGATEAISDMARSIDQVSTNAVESANVAERAVEIAGKGSLVVHNTIGGMDRIRGQIQLVFEAYAAGYREGAHRKES